MSETATLPLPAAMFNNCQNGSSYMRVSAAANLPVAFSASTVEQVRFVWMNAGEGDFIDDGVTPDLAHYAMHALGNRIWVYSAEAFDDADAPTPADADHPAVVEYMTTRFPHVVVIAMDAMGRNPTGGCDQQRGGRGDDVY